MPKISDTPKLLPITNDRFGPEDYAAVPSRVKQVVAREPPKLAALWQDLAADGVITKSEGERFLDAVARESRLLDGRERMNSTEAKLVGVRLRQDVTMDPQLRARLEAHLKQREQRMLAGRVFNGTFAAGDSLHTFTEGIADIPYADFIARLPPELWAANLADYRGGEIKVTERDARGRVVKQRERMVTETPHSKILYALFGRGRATNLGLPNDMTKVESIHYDDQAGSVAIRWEVLDSDNRTTLKDIGQLRFYRHQVAGPDGRPREVTKIEFESEHRIDAFPGTLGLLEALPGVNVGVQALTERTMRGYFTACIERYQAVARGEAPCREAPRAK